MKKGYIQAISYLCKFLLILFPALIYGDYPELKSLNSGNLLFRQLQEDIDIYYKVVNRLGNRLNTGRSQTVNIDDLPGLKIFFIN